MQLLFGPNPQDTIITHSMHHHFSDPNITQNHNKGVGAHTPNP